VLVSAYQGSDSGNPYIQGFGGGVVGVEKGKRWLGKRKKGVEGVGTQNLRWVGKETPHMVGGG